ncbi:hypothetical protein ANCDUO_06388 [Ancylostoma duodenale]|uniref:Tubulin/FtsZ GTPase domain-containing protein n=1 Tax=Ancylostoma duodenale TaxID=51022 RepID=A0A0C2DL23_9BILA|nr:hypothetical protein ANCDUO_06388 [Ancylostoma duodenale]
MAFFRVAKLPLFAPHPAFKGNGDGRMIDFNYDDQEAFNTFFAETAGGKHVPRCLFVDLEPTVVGTFSAQTQHRMPEQIL